MAIYLIGLMVRLIIFFHFCLLICLFTPASLYSQEVLQITVIDSISKEPVKNASIYNKSQNKYLIADNSGVLKNDLRAGDTIEITCIGFVTKATTVGAGLNTIPLSHQPITLDEVKIYGKNVRFYKNATGSQSSWQLHASTTFFTFFEIPAECKSVQL